MVFDSFSFLVFFCTFFLLYWFVFDKKIQVQNFLILAGSYVFYSWWNWRFLIVLVACSLINYLLGYYMGKTQNKKTKKRLLYAGVVYGVGTLLYFKYTNFFISSFIDAFAKFNLHLNIHTLYIVLPLGISFYTFKTLSYLFDIYKNKIQPTSDWVVFFTYTAFFPCLISGPIDRAGTLIPQLNNKRAFNYDLAGDGMRQILWGAFKKTVIADSCSLLTEDMFVYYRTLPASSLVLGAFYFTIQVYANFSGYSDMAIGFAKLLGFNVTRNFDYPFFSQNIAEFWRKWHMSLTTWLTEYLFIPLTTKLSWSGPDKGDSHLLAISTLNSGVFGADSANNELMIPSQGAASDVKSERTMIVDSQLRPAILNKEDNTGLAYQGFKPLHQLISEIAAQNPDQTAITFGGQNISYRELDKKANQLAALLISKNVKKGDNVGFSIDRGIEMVVLLLAIMRTGAVYIPLDPQFPLNRINYMLDDSKAAVLLVSEKYKGRYKSAAMELILEEAWKELNNYESVNPATAVYGDDLIYILYTSGSTGNPKGVQIMHHNLTNLLASIQQTPGIGAADKLLAVSTISFDIAGVELFLPLTSGAEIVLASAADAKDGRILLDIVKQEKITMMQATPYTWRIMLEAGWDEKTPIKVLCTGEALPQELAEKLLVRASSLWNLYGPTETTIFSTLKQLTSADMRVTIGWPINNTSVYILDEFGRPLAADIPGELFIGGDGVAKGYLNRAELTAEKFLDDPFAGTPGAKMYRTGDLGKFGANGEIEYLGRIDAQVKIRGFRIETGEIEFQLSKEKDIKEGVVIARPDQNGVDKLVAFIVVDPYAESSNNSPAQIQHWKDSLKKAVPEYMVPDSFILVPKMPLTPNGKVDRKLLAKSNAIAVEGPHVYVAPRTDMERLLAGIWAEFLGAKEIGVHDNFIELGGHSLIAVQMMTRIEKQTGKRLSLAALFDAATVEKLAQQVEAAPKTGKKSRPVFNKAGLIASTIITLTIAGIWHGANWNFVLFGFIHGCYFIPLILDNRPPKNKKPPVNKLQAAMIKLAKTLGTFILVMFSFVIFWADSIRHAFSYLYHMFSWSLFTNPLHALPPHRVGFLLPAIIVLLIAEWIQRKKQFALQIEDIKYTWVRWAIYMLILGICLSNMSEASKFIYAKF